MSLINLSVKQRELLAERLQAAGFVQAVDPAEGKSADPTARLPLESRPSAELEELSFAQQRLWFLEQFTPGQSIYNIPLAIRIRGRCAPFTLGAALSEVVRRHEILRARVFAVDGEPRLVVRAPCAINLNVVDLRQLPGEARERAAQDLIRQASFKPFDLTNDWLIRARTLLLEDDELILVLTVHHIASDHWSRGVLLEELATLYQAFLAHQPSPLEDIPIQYLDVARWQRQRLASSVAAPQLAYWKQILTPQPPSLSLPTDFPRPSGQSHRGAVVTGEIPRALTTALNELSRREGSTLFMTCLAGLQLLLARYCGQSDFAIGTPIAGRNVAETERLIGFFANTVVLRSSVRGNPSIRDFLRQVRKSCLGAFDHQELPFELLVEELGPERNLSQSPLFQVMFVLLNAPRRELALPGLQVDRLKIPNQNAMFDLTLFLWETDQGLSAELEYSTELFARATVERMLANYETLLASLVGDANRRIGHLQLLSESERRIVLAHVDQASEAESGCLHKLFEYQAEQTPEAVAIVFAGQHLSYRELNARANQIASYLRSLGVGPESRVGICVDRSLDLVAGVLGILKSGAAYVPLDPDYPSSRLQFMSSDARLAVLLTAGSRVESALECCVPVVRLDADRELIARQPQSDFDSGARSSDVAYVIYTSGSTGQPKGVVMEHGAVCHLLQWQRRATRLPPGARTLQYASLSFDVSCQELFHAWSCGGTLVMIAEDAKRDVERLVSLVVSESIECLFLPYVALEYFSAEANQQDLQNCPLREVITAGEQLRATASIRNLFKHSDCRLINQYGPTETHVVSAFELSGSPDTWPHLPPIGRAVDGCELVVLDEHGRLCPLGVAGHLYIGGRQVARGYLDRPALTAERFVPSPFSREPGSRLYYSGDTCRCLADSNFEFLGRSDNQVKVRGFRIELGEVEAVLAQYPGVRACAVTAFQDSSGSTALAGYFQVRDGDSAPGDERLRAFLGSQLPDYMVPSVFIRLDALPLTPSGKVNRRELPTPRPTPNASATEFVAPRDAIEMTLAKVWSDALKVEQIGVGADFFKLGGHSLMAVKIASQLRREFAVEIRLATLFEHPTLEGLANAIRTPQGQRRHSNSIPLKAVERDGSPLPLSFPQRRLWFLEQLAPGRPTYNVSEFVRLRGQLDIQQLERCLQRIVNRHEVLRTTIATVNGNASQRVAPTLPLPLAVADLSEWEEQRTETELHRLLAAEAKRPFLLDSAPLIRAFVIRLARDHHVLAVTLHHLICDRRSLDILFHELTEQMRAEQENRPAELSELSVQYADFSNWQQRWLQSDEFREQLGYWRDQLAELPAELAVPTDRPRPRSLTFRGAEQIAFLPAELTAKVKELGRRQGVTLFTTLLAAFMALLHRYSGQRDIVVGSPVDTRDGEELDGLIGFFVNMLVLRAKIDGDPEFLEFLQRARQTIAKGFANQLVPFERLVEELRPLRDPSRQPFFQVMFQLLEGYGQVVDFPELAAETIHFGTATSKFDISVTAVEQSNGELLTHWEYATDLFNSATIEQMALHFRILLEGIVAAPARRLSQFRLLPPEEWRELIDSRNATWAELPAEACIHELFEAQVRRSPDAIAVECGDRQVSYGCLNGRANQLAHRLRSLGVSYGDLVGLYMDRSVEMLVAILAILKAGAAYLPIDAGNPPLRNAFILRDARVGVLLAHRHLLANGLEFSGEVLMADGDWGVAANEPAHNPRSDTSAADLAYVNYTSGSTGTPKGVEVCHRGVVRLLFGAGYVDLDAGQVLLHHSTVSFDASTFEIWGALLHGGRCAVLEQGVLTPDQYSEALNRYQVTTLWMTSALFNSFVDHDPAVFASLSQLLIGGEALSVRHVLGARARLQSLRLTNGYGPTESTTFTCCYGIPTDISSDVTSIPIGLPIANTRVYVLDGHLNPVPVGVSGELHIGGDGLARGYLHAPALTAERFIPDPFGGQAGGRLYRSGDLVRHTQAGVIEYLGRRDNQVKVRGFRIELGEIESALNQCPGVTDSVVVARGDASSSKQLVAYVVMEATGATERLRELLQQRLPSYMVPAAFVPLPELPLTDRGKVDRSSLPAPVFGADDGKRVRMEPRNATERVLANIWKDLLGVAEIGVDENLFELGGHSLLIIQLVSQIQKALQRSLPIATVLQCPTIAELARWLDGPPQIRMDGQPRTRPLICLNYGLKLARHVTSDLPIYALDSNPREALALTTVEDIAAFYVRAMKSIAPTGPYRLLGYCVHGVVAFEMARQLAAKGEQVEWLALIDVPWPYRESLLRKVRYYGKRLRYHVASSWRLGLRASVQPLLARALRFLRSSSSVMTAGANGAGLDLWDHIATLLAAYEPGPISCPTALFLACPPGSSPKPTDSRLRWSQVSPAGSQAHFLAVKHLAIFEEPHIQELAHKLESMLRQYDESQGLARTPPTR